MALLLCLTMAVAGCTPALSSSRKLPTPYDSAAIAVSKKTPARRSSSASTSPPIQNRAWHGPVEELFVHPLVSNADVIPLVDAEVARHPDFSADGAKGVIAVTGYEGLLGEHHPEQPAARARLIAAARWLRADGWTFASHTWGHIDLSASSRADIARDTQQWKAEADGILGPTDVLVYPFGARPDAAGLRQLAEAGYKIQLDIDVVARTSRLEGAIRMSRRHVDGYAFDVPRRQAPF